MSQLLDTVTGLPYVFRGGLAFNQRTVAKAAATLLSETESGDSLLGTPISILELTNVLLLLESIAMSNGMYLDGTLPPDDVTRLETTLWRLRSDAGVSIRMEFVSPDGPALPSMFRDAAQTASLLIQHDLDRLEAQTDDPMRGDVSKFIAALGIGAADPTGRLAAEFAERTSADVAEGRESFRGSKCVAGLLLAGSDPVPLAALAYTRLAAADDATQRRIVALLINRFRINYVNTLAGLRDAAYLADTSIEDLKAAQVFLFARYLASRIAASHVDSLSEATQAAFDKHLTTVPLGFAILLNSSGSSPLGLLEEAASVRDSKFGAAAARDTPQTRYPHQFNAAEFASVQDYLFKDKFVALLNEAERRAMATSTLREVKIPSAVGGVVGAILGALAGGPAGAAAGSVVGSLVQHLGEQLATGQLGSRRVHIDHYRRLDAYMALAAKNDRLATPIREKVERVFGRPLQPG